MVPLAKGSRYRRLLLQHRRLPTGRSAASRRSLGGVDRNRLAIRIATACPAPREFGWPPDRVSDSGRNPLLRTARRYVICATKGRAKRRVWLKRQSLALQLCPISALPARCRSPRRRSPDRTESRRSGLSPGIGRNAPKRTLGPSRQEPLFTPGPPTFDERSHTDSHTRVGLVLEGGGAKGAYAIGCFIGCLDRNPSH